MSETAPVRRDDAGPCAEPGNREAGAGDSRTGHRPGAVVPGAGPLPRAGAPTGEGSGGRPTLRLREDGPAEAPRYAPEWLRLREAPDAAARSRELLDPLRNRLTGPSHRPCSPGRSHGTDPFGPPARSVPPTVPCAPPGERRDGLVIHDLGCGTGSMGRWLAPRLDGAQHWVLHDRDPRLLHRAAAASPRAAADGSRVTVETRRGEIARLTADALAGASLVTASALLDVLGGEEMRALAAACAGAGCPALLTLSVAGRVALTPPDPLDAPFTEAFNAHQRRSGLLGPDAVAAASDAFGAYGATVLLRPSPWRLGPDERALTGQWLRGWVAAAVEHRPGLRAHAGSYLERRLIACGAGELSVVVHHTDMLALCRRPAGGAP